MKPDTKAIRARADAATSAPWKPHCDYQDDLHWLCNDKDYADIYGPDGSYDGRIGSFRVGRTEEEQKSFTMDPVDKARVAANITFIVAARTDVPELCDRVDALEAALTDALALYTEHDSPEAYARYRAACAVLEGK